MSWLINVFIITRMFCYDGFKWKSKSRFKVITRGAPKSAIESQPIKFVSSEPQKNGNTIVKYQYTSGKEPNAGRAIVYVLLDGLTLFISELFTMPAEMSRGGVVKTINVEYNAQGQAVRVF